MNVEQKINIHNRFDIHVDNIKTGKHKEYKGYNILLDSIYTRLCNRFSYFVNIHFGTGTGTPTAAGTSLFTHLGTKTAVDEEIVKAFPISSWKRKVVLAPEEYVGQTITELGIAWGATSSYLMTHAMIKDSEGNPISITKTDIDVVTIYATVYVTLSEPNTGVRYTALPNSNAVLNYLIGGTAFPTMYCRLGSGLGPQIRSSLGVGLPLLGSKSVSMSADIPNKKILFPTVRFDIGSGNGNVSDMDYKNLFRMSLPTTGIHAGRAYTDVPIGVGDGAEDTFDLPSRNIDTSTIEIKVNGIIVSHIVNTKSEYKENYAIGSNIEGPYNSIYTRIRHTRSLNYVVYPDKNKLIHVIKDYGKLTQEDKYAFTPTNVTSIAMMDVDYDAETIAIGNGAIPYQIVIFKRIDGAYVEDSIISVGNVPQGVALSSDGKTLAYGTIYDECNVFDYDDINETWIARGEPASTPGGHLRDVALNPDGTIFVAVSETSTHGVAYDWSGTAWTKRANPPTTPGLQYPGYVVISDDGNVLGVTAISGSPVKFAVYDWDGAAWTHRSSGLPASINTGSGTYASLSHDLAMAVEMSYNTGAATRILIWNGSSWEEQPTSNLVSLSAAPHVIGFLRDNANVLIIPSSANAAEVQNIFMGVDTFSITLTSAPAQDAVITADYTVDGVHKTVNQVIDVSCSIQFGEGV